jgi:aconitate hydratase 2/2-methylisocitrate dehydratase
MVNRFEENYSVATGTVLTINTKEKNYITEIRIERYFKIIYSSKMEFIKAGGSYAIVFGKKIQTFAAKTLGIKLLVFCSFKRNFYRRTRSYSC